MLVDKDIVMSNVKGRAQDAIPSVPKTAQEIREAIEGKIKPEKAKIIEGKMLALKLDKGGYTEFSNKVEKLADQYARSLVAEGTSKEKAIEFAVEQTVKLCKSNARDQQVKTTLTAATFHTVKDVLNKYVTVTQEEIHKDTHVGVTAKCTQAI